MLDAYVIAVIDPLGHARSTVYDVLQRPQASWLPDGTRTTTVYDVVGNPIASVSPLGTITTQLFVSRNRLIGRQDPLNSEPPALTDLRHGRAALDGAGCQGAAHHPQLPQLRR
jgi:YD repeat-containing protein